MFTSIINILTTIAIASHAVLGCCAHHSHSCHGHESSPTATVESQLHTCEHHAHSGCETSEGEQESQGDPHRDHHQPCDEADCQFVFTANTNDVLQALEFDYQVACNDSLPALNALAPQFIEGQFEHHSLSLTTTEPLHALKQVWLL